jgi:hypothetical protein
MRDCIWCVVAKALKQLRDRVYSENEDVIFRQQASPMLY